MIGLYVKVLYIKSIKEFYMKRYNFLFLKLCISFFSILLNLQANSYPNKEINIIVGFSEGGATHKMTKIMAPYLQEELKQKINIIPIPGEGSYLAAKHFLKEGKKGYTIFASTFAPYLANTILTKQAEYKIDDFSMINLQWFDTDMIVVNKHSKVDKLLSLLKQIKENKNKMKTAVIYKSSGHLLLNLLLEKYKIPKKNLEINFYKGGNEVRQALFKNNLDFIIVPAQGSETYRSDIKALAINSSERTKRWDAPTLNEILELKNITIPLLHGSMRGFSVSKEFENSHPKRYKKLIQVFRKVLAKKKVQKELKRHKIGYFWIGPRHSNRLIKESYIIYKEYNYLFK